MKILIIMNIFIDIVNHPKNDKKEFLILQKKKFYFIIQ